MTKGILSLTIGGVLDEYDTTTLKRLIDKAILGSNGCILFTGCTCDKGYGIIKYKGRACKAHRIVYRLCVHDIPDDIHILHKCDNPPCINPEHLFPGTDQDNIDDMISKGRQVILKGSTNGRATLSETDVIEIRRIYDGRQMNVADLARKYNLNWISMNRLVKRISWRHV